MSNINVKVKISPTTTALLRWGSITGNIPDQSDLQTLLNSKQNSLGFTPVQSNNSITAGTKTKITYDAKGLVLSGGDATATDIVANNQAFTVLTGENTQTLWNETDQELSTLNAFIATKENSINKAIDFAVRNNTLYPTTKAVNDLLKVKEVVIDPTGNGDYLNIEAALDANQKYLYIKDGIHTLNNTRINLNNCILKGQSKVNTILRVAAGQDGLVLYSNNNLITNLTIDAETLTGSAALVIGDGMTAGNANFNKGCFNLVTNCIIKGSSTTFGIFCAGASYTAGTNTLDNFANSTLQYGNRFIGNELYSSWDGDSYSISLQKYCRFDENICYSGRVAFYMNRTSSCCDNKIIDSTAQGIFIAAPCYDNIINRNQIFNCASTGIKIEYQLEHAPMSPSIQTGGNIICNNVVQNARFHGLECSGNIFDSFGTPTEFSVTKNIITNNHLINSGFHGIYLQYTKGNNICSNYIDTPKFNTANTRGSGIFMVANVQNNNIIDNYITDTRNKIVHTAIANREDNTCTGNRIINNYTNVSNSERTIWVQSNENDIIGNRVEGGNYAGIFLDGASDCLVTSNRLRKNTNDAANSYFEIWVKNGASNNIITNNRIMSVAGSNNANAGVFLDSGSNNNIVSNNIISGTTNQIIDNGANNTVATINELRAGRNPNDLNLITWSFDPAVSNSTQIANAGQLYVVKLKVTAPTTITNILVSISGAGVGLTSGQCFAGLFDSNRVLLSATADQSTSWNSIGVKTMALSAPQTVNAGVYYVAFYANAATTLPTFRIGTSSSSFANANLSTANSIYGTANTGLTTALPSTFAAISGQSVSWWVGLS